MPYTSYGLLKALRSHQITSPTVKATLQTGRPNACNLCHLDKSLDWTAQKLAGWYNVPLEPVPPEDKNISAAVLWALKGDSGQRVLTAWHMGWKSAQQASDSSWFAPYLAMLLEDPYAAVRYVAGRSLKRLPGYTDFTYDYVASTNQLRRASEQASDLWRKNTQIRANPCLLIQNDGQLDEGTVKTLLQARDDRVLDLQE